MSWFKQYFDFVQNRSSDLAAAMLEHLSITLISVALGCLIAVPLGIFLASYRNRWLHSILFGAANVFQTIPSLALLAIMIPLLGIGVKPAVTALFLYSLLPIMRNTYAGIASVPPDVIEAARGMGMSRAQRLLQIQLPLAFPYMMSGIRVTTVYIISWATLASLIGAGGLGQLIFAGMGVNKTNLIVSGAILAILLAFLAEFLLGRIEKRLTRRVKPAHSAA
jgi:osmoprotectant transport system permease protein